MRARFGAQEVALAYSQGAYTARVDGARVALRFLALDPQRARLELDSGREENVAYAIDGDTVHLARAGRSWRLENLLYAPPAKRAAGNTVSERWKKPRRSQQTKQNIQKENVVQPRPRTRESGLIHR